MNCAALESTLTLRVDDRLPAEQAAEFDSHLSVCSVCRAEAERSDPTLVFRALRSASASALDTEAMLAGIRQGITLHETERRSRIGHSAVSGSGFRRLAAAALLLAAGTAAFRAIPRRSVPVAAAITASARPAVAVDRRPAAENAAIESLDRPDARVYDLSDGDLNVVMIVDSGMDL